ncbi:MAG: hypothetical protein AAGA43_12505 [Bacteroidota bacterium]
MKLRDNQTICEHYGATPNTPKTGSIIGLAIDSLEKGIVHGLRHKPENGTNGWYIWCGEYSNSDDFFKPICVEHLNNYLKVDLKEYLDLPPGYRFLIDATNYEDVWFDKTLIE